MSFFEWLLGGSGVPPTPRKLLHGRHPLYPKILKISNSLITDEVSAAEQKASNTPPLQKPFNVSGIAPILGPFGPAGTVTVLPQIRMICVAGGLGASEGRTVSGGPLVAGNLENSKAITEGLSVSGGLQFTPALGVQGTGNLSGGLLGPTVGIPGSSVAVTYGRMDLPKSS